MLLVSDQGLGRAGVTSRVADQLTNAGLPLGCHLHVPLDPTFDDVDLVVAAARGHRADTVVSVGSGSVLAAGRGAAVAATHDGSSAELAASTVPPARRC